jgi:WD40 repeat protein
MSCTEEAPKTDSLLDFQQELRIFSKEEICCQKNSNFVKGGDISPDGSLMITVEESNWLKLWAFDAFSINDNRYYCDVTSGVGGLSSLSADSPQEDTVIKHKKKMSLTSQFNCGESIYDFDWYPFMSSNDVVSSCIITTCRDHPIHLWDIASSTIRCSYRCYNRVDEVEAANSITFNLTGDKIYAGSNRAIRCFDVACPGRTYTEQATCKTRRSPEGQRGIISCLSFNPDYSGAYAAGSYAHSISIYVENMKGSALELADIDFGATHLRWSPCGTYLWGGGRAHEDIICWDLRHTRSELGRVKRALTTNQRMTFDLDPWGKYLATGDQTGRYVKM